MAIQTRTIQLSTKGNADVLDITDRIAGAIVDTNLNRGIVTVFCASSTSALTTIEYEPGAISDLRRYFDEAVNPNREYAHNARWGDGNGHSHLRAALLKPDITIPFTDRKLILGTWQQVIYVDFDIRPRKRELVLQIIGE